MSSKPPLLDPRSGKRPAIEHRHARASSITSCAGLSLIGRSGNDAAVYPLRCRRWSCGSCGLRKVREAQRRVADGLAVGPVWFVTITCAGGEDPVRSFELLTRRWKALHQRLNRATGRCEYWMVIETQKRGSPHLHILVRGRRPSARWLAAAAVAVGFGSEAKIKRAGRGLAGYLTKAIGPGTSAAMLPRHFRRLRWSAGWTPPVKRRMPRRWDHWVIAIAGPARAAQSVLARGYRLIELVHGPPERRTSTRPVRWVPVRAFGPHASVTNGAA